ncbi:MAG: PEGA domain-containing protein [Kofleriaceae bacterium]
MVNLFAVSLPEFTPAQPVQAAKQPQRPLQTPTPTGEEDLETTYIPKLGAAAPLPWKKLAIGGGAVAFVAIVAAIALGGKKAPATTPVDLSAFVPKYVEPPPPPAPKPVAPKLVDVRLNSTPSGATATLLDTTTGNTQLLGTTPVDATIDPSKAYDVRFEMEGRPSATEHLDPAKASLDVAMADPEVAAPVPAPVVDKKHRHHHAAVAAKKAKRVAVASAPATRSKQTADSDDGIAQLAAAKKGGAAPAAGGDGFVMVTSSAPAAILVDGVNSGKTTPAKITVPAGHHSIRLIAATAHINKQISVDVTAKKTVKVSD